VGSLIGGIVSALVVYLLAYRRGVQGMRLIVVGISVAAMLNAVNSYLLITAGKEQAVSAAAWGAGSLNEATWNGVLILLASILVLLPVTMATVRHLRMLELGDDSASALGVPAERTRVVMLFLGVGYVSVITALTGPIAFVALMAPQLARRVTGAAGVVLLPAALMGGLLLQVSDVLARTLVAPSQLPVGVVTSCLGGSYLVWLLIRQASAR
jgi:iron complex transport system permease protein